MNDWEKLRDRYDVFCHEYENLNQDFKDFYAGRFRHIRLVAMLKLQDRASRLAQTAYILRLECVKVGGDRSAPLVENILLWKDAIDTILLLLNSAYSTLCILVSLILFFLSCLISLR